MNDQKEELIGPHVLRQHRPARRVGERTRRAALMVLALVVILGLWAFWWEPSSLVVRSYDLHLDRWPAKPISVALLADLHTGSPYHGLEMLGEIVEQTNAQEVDLVLLAGDFVIQGVVGGEFVPPEATANALGKLKARYGVYAVLGNHDWWLGGARVSAAFKAAGITMLEDRAIPLPGASPVVWLAGVSDFTEAKADVARSLANVPKSAKAGPATLLFTHNPDVFPKVPERVHLSMAGHTHGGQVALPLLGRLVVPSRFGDRYAIGHIIEKGHSLFVTPGLGTSILPVRFRVPPEISILQISR